QSTGPLGAERQDGGENSAEEINQRLPAVRRIQTGADEACELAMRAICNAAHGPIAIRSNGCPDLAANGKDRVWARLGWAGEKGSRRRWLVALALALSGCVPTADFTELRDDVRELQSDNKKLKQTEAELRKRLEVADRNQLAATTSKRLDVVEAALTDLKTRQQ